MLNNIFNVFVILLVFMLPTASLAAARENNIINIEIIMFANLNNKIQDETKELFPLYTGELNKSHITENLDLTSPLKHLEKEYNKLKNNQNYKIILHATKEYTILPSRKNHKFFIKTEDIAATLSVSPNPARNNYFTVTLDSIYLNNRLTKTVKIKNKEIYYFDHPVFGALITLY